MQGKCLIGQKEYPIVCYAETFDESGKSLLVPIADAAVTDCYKWNLGCLKSRLESPEIYAQFENVELKIEQLKQFLLKHRVAELEEIKKSDELEAILSILDNMPIPLQYTEQLRAIHRKYGNIYTYPFMFGIIVGKRAERARRKHKSA